jgi:hypothetical protein
MRKFIVAYLSIAAVLAPVTQTQAAPALNGKACLGGTSGGLTSASHLSTMKILDGLGLSVEQVKELRARLSQLTTASKPNYTALLADLGLTAEQRSSIQQRIEAQLKPAGYPCLVFKHPKSVIAFLKPHLKPFTQIRYTTQPRLISSRFVDALDHSQKYGASVVKTSAKTIMVRLDHFVPKVWTDSLGTHTRVQVYSRYYTFNPRFEA